MEANVKSFSLARREDEETRRLSASSQKTRNNDGPAVTQHPAKQQAAHLASTNTPSPLLRLFSLSSSQSESVSSLGLNTSTSASAPAPVSDFSIGTVSSNGSACATPHTPPDPFVLPRPVPVLLPLSQCPGKVSIVFPRRTYMAYLTVTCADHCSLQHTLTPGILPIRP